MNNNWFSFLKSGLSRQMRTDRIGSRLLLLSFGSSLQNLRPFIGRHWRKGLLGVGLVVLSSILGFPQPLIMRYLVDEVILGRHLHRLLAALLLLVGIALAERLTRLVEEFYFARFEQEVIIDIQEDLFARALRLPKTFFDENQTGYLMSRLGSDVQGLRWFFSSSIVYVVSNFLRFVGGLVFLFYLEKKLAAAVLILLPGLFLFMRYLARRIRVLSHQTMEEQASVASHLQESLASIPLIKSFTTERRTVDQLISRLRDVLQVSLEQTTVNSLGNLLAGSLPGVGRATVLTFGAYWVITGQWTLGSLLAFQAYLGYVFGPAQFLATANLHLQSARAALERVSALYDIVPEETPGTGEVVKRLGGEIEFRNVSFSYNGRDPVLKNISFRIKPGERVAITAPSGVGKTTLLSLVLGFYRPTSGEIYFDGRPASEYHVTSLRGRIGYVAQSALLISGTIMENLRYGNQDATEAQVVHAAKLAGIHEFISGLPAGYATELGDKGMNLSEGERQRLALARALVKEPDIFVLDEPTSALDGQTEASIFRSLPSFLHDRTVLVATHRLSTVVNLDRVLWLDQGRALTTSTCLSLVENGHF